LLKFLPERRFANAAVWQGELFPNGGFSCGSRLCVLGRCKPAASSQSKCSRKGKRMFRDEEKGMISDDFVVLRMGSEKASP
jgi:hypothetical protein